MYARICVVYHGTPIEVREQLCLGSWFSLSTFIWVQGSDLVSSGQAGTVSAFIHEPSPPPHTHTPSRLHLVSLVLLVFIGGGQHSERERRA